MARTVVGLFPDSTEAQAALQDLRAAGFPREHLNLVAYGGSGLSTPERRDLGSATTTGAAAGGLAGLLLGLAAVAIPGVGPIIAAGPIAAALTGAGVGAATGGMLGALADMGVPGHEAHYYEEAIRRGGTLLIVQADEDTSERAQSILERHGALDMQAMVDEWCSQGWSPENTRVDAQNFGDEGGSSQWNRTTLSHSGERRTARIYLGNRRD